MADARSQSQRMEADLESVKGQIESLMLDEEGDPAETRARAERRIEGAKEKRESYSGLESGGSLPSEEEEVQGRLTEAEEELEAAAEEIESELRDLSPEDLKERKNRTADALETTREERTQLKSDLDKVQGRRK